MNLSSTLFLFAMRIDFWRWMEKKTYTGTQRWAHSHNISAKPEVRHLPTSSWAKVKSSRLLGIVTPSKPCWKPPPKVRVFRLGSMTPTKLWLKFQPKAKVCWWHGPSSRSEGCQSDTSKAWDFQNVALERTKPLDQLISGCLDVWMSVCNPFETLKMRQLILNVALSQNCELQNHMVYNLPHWKIPKWWFTDPYPQKKSRVPTFQRLVTGWNCPQTSKSAGHLAGPRLSSFG